MPMWRWLLWKHGYKITQLASPCLDRHSQDITLALVALYGLGRTETAKEWLKKLFRNLDYAFKAKKFVPVATDSLDDLIEDGGWLCGQAN